MTNWPFSKRKPESRVVVKLNSDSFQCRTLKTVSVLIAAMGK